jgi:MFS family permease
LARGPARAPPAHLGACLGLRPTPFLLGLAYAGGGLGLSALFVRETHDHARYEATFPSAAERRRSTGEVFILTSFRERALSAASQAGLVTNLKDGLAWGLLPIYYAATGLSVAQIGVLAAIYPAVWGIGRLATGIAIDRTGRKGLITAGMLVQGAALAGIATFGGFGPWAVAPGVLGVGTAMVYPVLLAAVGAVAHPSWRASALGIYRLWRDLGFAVGGLVAGGIADLAGMPAAIWVVAALAIASGLTVLVRMYETHPAGSAGPLRLASP